MPISSGFAVAKIAEAQEKMREATHLIISARLNTVDLSGATDSGDFRGTPLERGLDRLASDIGDQADALDNEIRGLALLIPERP